MKTHGDSTKNSPYHYLYSRYYCMKDRCYNAKAVNFQRYGGRGIKVSDEWFRSYSSFKWWSIQNGCDPSLQLDRINNNQGYSSENCRWVTPQENSNNRRGNRRIPFDGKTKTLAQWSRSLSLNYKTLHNRLSLGWTVSRTFTTQVNTGRYHSNTT